jgi:transport family protein 27
MTLAAEVSVKGVFNEEHNAQVEFFMYDVSGSTIYEYEYADVFRDANQIMVVFDVTRSSTLTQCAEWLDKVAKYAGKSLPGVLVGNKSDLAEFADVSPDDCKNFATEHGLVYFEVSAKTSAGLVDPFNELGEKFIALYESEVDHFINAE